MSALVRWLPKLAVASADDIRRFGPQAARVRTLLDFIPTMSKDAVRASYAGHNDAKNAAWHHAMRVAMRDARRAARNDAWEAADDAAWDVASYDVNNHAKNIARGAAWGEVVSDLITPENYRSLTKPLATGRAVDVLMPRYKDTQFRELLQELVPKRVITQPSDVLGVGRIASLPDEVAIREAIDLVANYGMTFEEALNVIRMV